MVTPVDALTAEVVILNAPWIAPEGTVMLAGTVAALGFELASVTTVPAGGAGTLNVTTFALLAAPPVSVLGLRVIPDGANAQ